MKIDRWDWFAAGLMLGLLLGGSAVGWYRTMELNKVRTVAEEKERECIEAAHDQAVVMSQAYRNATEERDRALKELEAMKKAQKDR